MSAKKTDRELVGDMLIRMEGVLAFSSRDVFDVETPGDTRDAYELFVSIEQSAPNGLRSLGWLLRDALERSDVAQFREVSFTSLSVLAPRQCILTEGAFEKQPDKDCPRAPSGDEWAEAAALYFASPPEQRDSDPLCDLLSCHQEAKNV